METRSTTTTHTRSLQLTTTASILAQTHHVLQLAHAHAHVYAHALTCTHALSPPLCSPKKISDNRIRDIFGKHGEVRTAQQRRLVSAHRPVGQTIVRSITCVATISSQLYLTRTCARSCLQVTQVKVLADRRFAYVGFHTDKAAAAAKRFLHNTYIDTSKIEVTFSLMSFSALQLHAPKQPCCNTCCSHAIAPRLVAL
jgi:hypothetical protein